MTEGGTITAAERAKPLPQIASSDLVSGHIRIRRAFLRLRGC